MTACEWGEWDLRIKFHGQSNLKKDKNRENESETGSSGHIIYVSWLYIMFID